MLAWWTLRGDKSDTTSQSADRIPAKVWEGGATLTIELETSIATRMYAAFGIEDRSLETSEEVQPGRHSWTIDVPPTGSLYLSASSDTAPVGAKMTWTVTVNGRVLDQQNETLNEPLQAGYAFGRALELDNVTNPAEVE
ncbi:MAG TPA: hypothetical protein VNN18_10185 [Candidatus Xenobia bacterium]|nr:hypothetical protein [Candidatus Xenobia bacterium]